ncbi:MAG: hypothetical protein WKF58_08805 [Ilumatobacteraceae bacterium]
MTSGAEDFNAFEWFPTGTLPWLLFLAVGVITALVVFDVLKSPARSPWIGSCSGARGSWASCCSSSGSS